MPRSGNIQAVTFDVGGTLIRPWPSVGHLYAEVAARHGHPNLASATLNSQFAASWRAKKNFNHSRHDWLELVKKTFAGLVDQVSVREFFDDLYDRFAAPEAWQVFDDVYPVLEELRGRGFKLGIISNWDERLLPLLKGLQLSRYFETIVVSVEVGFAKPSREIFARAMRLLALPPGAILHVGDSGTEDVAGARSAGFEAVHLDRRAATIEAGSIAALPMLTKILGKPHSEAN